MTTKARYQALRDRPWCPWRLPRTAKAKHFIKTITERLCEREEQCALRQRKRREADAKTWNEIVSRVSLDVAHHHLRSHSGRAEVRNIAIPRQVAELACKSAYKSPAHSKALPPALDLLQACGFIQQTVGGRDSYHLKGNQTVISAGSELIRLVEELDLNFCDIGRDPTEEIIWLREDKMPGEDYGKRVEYTDTETTHRYRSEVRQINSWLDKADVSFALQAGELVSHIDITDRSLHRVFNCSRFDRGGRFGGGFWMNMKEMTGEAVSLFRWYADLHHKWSPEY